MIGVTPIILFAFTYVNKVIRPDVGFTFLHKCLFQVSYASQWGLGLHFV
jgi:hypothetical protein